MLADVTAVTATGVPRPGGDGEGGGGAPPGGGRRVPVATIKLQRRSTMDLLGGIRITKRCTNRGSRTQVGLTDITLTL